MLMIHHQTCDINITYISGRSQVTTNDPYYETEDKEEVSVLELGAPKNEVSPNNVSGWH